MSIWSSTRVCHPETDNNKRYFRCDDEQWQCTSLAYVCMCVCVCVCLCVCVCVCVCTRVYGHACVKAMLPLYTHWDMHGMYMYNGHLTSQIVYD